MGMICRKFEYPSALRGQFNAGVLKEVCKTLRKICPCFEYFFFKYENWTLNFSMNYERNQEKIV